MKRWFLPWYRTIITLFLLDMTIAGIRAGIGYGRWELAMLAGPVLVLYPLIAERLQRHKVGEFLSMPFPQMWARIRGKPSSYDR